MANFNKFNCFVQDLAHKVHNLSSDQLAVALTNSAPVATNTVIGNITQVAYTFCSTRNVTTSSSGQTSGTYKLVLADLTLTATGGAVGAFQYVVLYNATTGNLIGWYDYGSSITLNDTETLLINFDDANGVLQLA